MAVGSEPEGCRNPQELDHIKPAFAPFIFGDKGLRLAQPPGYLGLREVGPFAGVPEAGPGGRQTWPSGGICACTAPEIERGGI